MSAEMVNFDSDLLIINNEEAIPTKKYKKKIKSTVRQPIYKKVRTDSFKPKKFKKAQLSKYIYPQENPIIKNSLNQGDNNSKYSIKNPVKERSKGKLNKNNSEIQTTLHKKHKKIKGIPEIIDNTDNNNDEDEDNKNFNFYENDGGEGDNEEIKIINNTNYNFHPVNYIKINNTDCSYNTYKNKNNYNNCLTKGGKINLNQRKKFSQLHQRHYTTYQNSDFFPRDRTSYIYDYSQDNDRTKDVYYMDYPNSNKHMTVYPLRPKLQKRAKVDFATYHNNNKKPKGIHEKLKAQIEDSRQKFEKIREIEKSIRNYFNINGLDIENRELYDQSATMIQSAFRAYNLRMKLFMELNLFVNIGYFIDIYKKIFLPRKKIYWDCFLKGILNYLSSINNININTDEINDDVNNEDREVVSVQKFTKKIPKLYKQKVTDKKYKEKKLLIPQLCVSFDLINSTSNNNHDNENNDNKNLDLINGNIINKNKYLEEKLNRILSENEELKKQNEELKKKLEDKTAQEDINTTPNNMVEDTQKSVELRFDENIKDLPLIFNNKDELKKSKLKNLVTKKIGGDRENLYKNFFRLYCGVNAQAQKEKNLKKIINRSENRIKKMMRDNFVLFYFKGLINAIQNKNNIEVDNGKNENEK